MKIALMLTISGWPLETVVVSETCCWDVEETSGRSRSGMLLIFPALTVGKMYYFHHGDTVEFL